MDFASLMSKEIAKTKSASPPAASSPTPDPSASSSSTSTNTAGTASASTSASASTPQAPSQPKKYIRRADLEAERLRAYHADQAARAAERAARADRKRKADEEVAVRNAEREEKRQRLAEQAQERREAEERERENARRRKRGLPLLEEQEAQEERERRQRQKEERRPERDNGDGDNDNEDEEEDVGAAVTEEQAREYSADDLTQRLRALDQPSRLFDEPHLERLRRLKRVERARERAARKSSSSSSSVTSRMTNGPIPTTVELLPLNDEVGMMVPATVPATDAERRHVYRQLASYFTLILAEWAAALARRPGEVAGSLAGRQAATAMLQARDGLRPLFRKFEADGVPGSMLGPLLEVVRAAQARRYVEANDAYLRFSIGKAAWPIGVTMVGIHERSAREKLHEGGQGHILADEVTRKVLQSVKRCLSFAQVRWPPQDLAQLMG